LIYTITDTDHDKINYGINHTSILSAYNNRLSDETGLNTNNINGDNAY